MTGIYEAMQPPVLRQTSRSEFAVLEIGAIDLTMKQMQVHRAWRDARRLWGEDYGLIETATEPFVPITFTLPPH